MIVIIRVTLTSEMSLITESKIHTGVALTAAAKPYSRQKPEMETALTLVTYAVRPRSNLSAAHRDRRTVSGGHRPQPCWSHLQLHCKSEM